MTLHCIIRQENLCAKISNSALNDVMSRVTEIVGFLVARTLLQYTDSFELCLNRWKVHTMMCHYTAVSNS